MLAMVNAGLSSGARGHRPDPQPLTATAPIAASTNTSIVTTAPPESTVAPAPPSDVTPDPSSLLVLVDRDRQLPDGWEPTDLVDPEIAFTFDGPHPKRLLRNEAAEAIERLVGAARSEGVTILGVSAYRSAQTQRDLFAGYAARDGEEVAATYSARPGHSEHQTGLAIDVTGGDGRCPAERCFEGTSEARWLETNAHRFGFIVRYPKGASTITGYRYEPWHLRYVGTDAAQAIVERGITLESFLGAA